MTIPARQQIDLLRKRAEEMAKMPGRWERGLDQDAPKKYKVLRLIADGETTPMILANKTGCDRNYANDVLRQVRDSLDQEVDKPSQDHPAAIRRRLG